MTPLNKNTALLVHSCDRYELLFKGFEIFFSKYWDFNINCNYYFATEEKVVAINNFENIRSGKGEWADRLKKILEVNIQEDYVLYFQEDMWLSKCVNAKFFTQIIELAQKNNWQQVKLHSSEVYKTIPTDYFIEGFNIATIDNANSDFLMSHQVTLWNKKFLIDQLKRKEHPWRNERKGTKRLKKINPTILHVDYFSENGSEVINKNNNPILRSEYNTISENGLLNSRIEPYITKLKNEADNHLQYAATLQYNYENSLTHDGRPKPRKIDIIKKIKNWLQGK